jgi:hypothetical protein
VRGARGRLRAREWAGYWAERGGALAQGGGEAAAAWAGSGPAGVGRSFSLFLFIF